MELLLFRGSPDFISSIIPALCLQFLFCLANIFSWNRIPLRNFIAHPTPPSGGSHASQKKNPCSSSGRVQPSPHKSQAMRSKSTCTNQTTQMSSYEDNTVRCYQWQFMFIVLPDLPTFVSFKAWNILKQFHHGSQTKGRKIKKPN